MLARELVLPHLLAARAQEHPDRTFLQEVDGRSVTYAEMHSAALTWADAYRRLGVRPGDRVAVMLPTDIDAVSAWLGLSWLRAVEVPVNTAYVGRMLRYLLEHSGSKLLVTVGEYVDRLREVADGLAHLETVVVIDDNAATDPNHTPIGRDDDAAAEGNNAATDDHTTTDPNDVRTDLPFRVVGRREFLAGASPADDLDGPGPADIATVMYTSGTTGPSKGVLMPWAHLHATASADIFTGDFGPDDALLPAVPLIPHQRQGPHLHVRSGGWPCRDAPFVQHVGLLGRHPALPLHHDAPARRHGQLHPPAGTSARRCGHPAAHRGDGSPHSRTRRVQGAVRCAGFHRLQHDRGQRSPAFRRLDPGEPGELREGCGPAIRCGSWTATTRTWGPTAWAS